MKTSTKLIIAAFIITIASMIGRDEQLKAAYLTKSYLNHFSNFATVDYKDFSTITVNSGRAANVKIVKGPFKVMVNKSVEKIIQFTQAGDKLEISAVFGKDQEEGNNYGGYAVYISCPSLKEFNLDSKFMLNGKMITDTSSEGNWHQNTISGFNEDSLTISMNNGCLLTLDSNNIRSLNAEAGRNQNSAPQLSVNKGNKISKASFNIWNNGTLSLSTPIPDLNYHIGDSASVTLTGNVGMGKR